MALDNEHPLVKLSRMRNVEIKLKASADGSMRLKGYSVNGSLLRIGSANESTLRALNVRTTISS